MIVNVVDFDAARFKAPFLLRCGALLIDYILLVAVPVVCLLLGRFNEYDGIKLLNSEITNIGWLIVLLLILTNFIIFPLLSGQTVGKLLTGLRIVNTDGHAASFGQLLARQLIGYPLTVFSLGFGFLLAAFNEKGRALHDFIARTIVVYGRIRTQKKEI